MIRRRKRSEDEVPDLPMDPMVDVVFQLLVFFLFSFQIRMLETVLTTEIAVPRLPAAQALDKDEKGPLKLTIQAKADGTLQGLTLEQEAVPNLEALPAALRQRETDRPLEKRKVALRPEDTVRYDVVVQAARTISTSGWQPQLGTTPAPSKEKQP